MLYIKYNKTMKILSMLLRNIAMIVWKYQVSKKHFKESNPGLSTKLDETGTMIQQNK